jgi:hypothetical protein
MVLLSQDDAHRMCGGAFAIGLRIAIANANAFTT